MHCGGGEKHKVRMSLEKHIIHNQNDSKDKAKEWERNRRERKSLLRPKLSH